MFKNKKTFLGVLISELVIIFLSIAKVKSTIFEYGMSTNDLYNWVISFIYIPLILITYLYPLNSKLIFEFDVKKLIVIYITYFILLFIYAFPFYIDAMIVYLVITLSIPIYKIIKSKRKRK